jgi:hypothetical protein
MRAVQRRARASRYSRISCRVATAGHHVRYLDQLLVRMLLSARLQRLRLTEDNSSFLRISYGTNFIGGEAAWRIPLALQLIPAIVLCGGAFFLPYSPRWLMLRGREEECLMTLANLRDAEPESLLIQSEYMALQAEQLVQEDEKHERYGPGKSEFYYAIRDYKRLLTTKTLRESHAPDRES